MIWRRARLVSEVNVRIVSLVRVASVRALIVAQTFGVIVVGGCP
jgi:hypothetical protein